MLVVQSKPRNSNFPQFELVLDLSNLPYNYRIYLNYRRGAYLIIVSLRGRLLEGGANSMVALIKKRDKSICHVLRNVYIYI